MSATSPSPGPTDQYVSEIRFGVVMYGGVSLAIYINGVANELYEMCCATPRAGVTLAPADPDKSPTRDIFHRLSYLCGSPELRRQYAAMIEQKECDHGTGTRRIADKARAMQDLSGAERQAAQADIDRMQCENDERLWCDAWTAPDPARFPQTRFVVDVISGTSAGGINGIFLAKALAEGRAFGSLKDLWIQEGDIGLLLNDGKSYEGLPFKPRPGHPASLLNSDRMYHKLLAAVRAMEKLPFTDAASALDSPFSEELDLFVTTTDIVGTVVPIRLFDKVVQERRHKQSYHLRAAGSAAGNDFASANDQFLAFAARCTSSFPFAFEPMSLDAVSRLARDADPTDIRQWNRYFPNLSKAEVDAGEHVHRAFGDGGYLDNKPFSYVADALADRFADVPIERKLIYIEPSPEHLDARDYKPDPATSPDALSNAVAALTSIPLYETIREDLQAVLRRNRRIERIERIVRQGEADIEFGLKGLGNRADTILNGRKWRDLPLQDLVEIHGAAFASYVRLRVAATTDMIADCLCKRWDVDNASDSGYALRVLVRVWRENHFSENGAGDSVGAFLSSYDIDFRLRRIGLLLRKTDQLRRLYDKYHLGIYRCGETGAACGPTDSEARLLTHIAEHIAGFDPSVPAFDDGRYAPVLAALQCLKSSLLATRRNLQALRCKSDVGTEESNQLLRSDLHVVLRVILGDAASDRNAVTDTQGNAQPVRLDPGLERVASASRTLQESIFLRAKNLLEIASASRFTHIQAALEASIRSLCLDSSNTGSHAGSFEQVASRVWRVLGRPDEAPPGTGPRTPVVGAMADDPGDPFLSTACIEALDTQAGRAMRELLSLYYLRFETFDNISFPLYFDTQTGEPATVEIVRVSPEDAVNLIDEKKDPARKKLAGTALANFGAFLDVRWRKNDVMWGRLDGIERLIQVLLPMADADTDKVRKALIDLAHVRILRQELMADGQKRLAQLFYEVVNELPKGSPDQQLQYLLAALHGNLGRNQHYLEETLRAVLSEAGLLRYVRNERRVDPNPEPESTLKSGARAVTVMGRVLEGIAQKNSRKDTLPRWLARVGLFFQGIIAVSLPGTIRQRIANHLLGLLYAFELVVLALAILLGGPESRSFAVTILGITLFIHAATLVIGDILHRSNRWIRRLIVLLLLVLCAFVVLGIVHMVGLLPPMPIIKL